MNRRHILSAVAVSAAAVGLAGATGAEASSASSEAPKEAATANITGVALPVVVDGRVRNYVFVAVRLHLAPGKAAEEVRVKEAYYRDALVRTAHRTSLALPDDWNKLSEAGISGAMLAIARVISGPDVVVRCEIVNQSPRRQARAPRLDA